MVVSARLQDLILMKSDDVKPVFNDSLDMACPRVRVPKQITFRSTIPIIPESHLDPEHVSFSCLGPLG